MTIDWTHFTPWASLAGMALYEFTGRATARRRDEPVLE